MTTKKDLENGANFLGLTTGACASGVIVSQGGYEIYTALLLVLVSSAVFALLARTVATRAFLIANKLREDQND